MYNTGFIVSTSFLSVTDSDDNGPMFSTRDIDTDIEFEQPHLFCDQFVYIFGV